METSTVQLIKDFGKSRESMTIEYNVLASPSNIPITFNECSLFKQYLNLDIDLEKLYADWSAIDPHIRKLLEEFDQLKGIRILYQEPLETLFAFICSANNNIKRISKMVNRLCTLYGTQLQLANNIPSEDKSVIEANSHLLYAFPTVEQMHKYSDNMEAQLRQDSFGYRAQYIAQSVKYLAENKIILESFRYPNKAKECLLKLTGVGPKVADCISLMGLGHHHVVPIDTHVFKSTVKNYRTDLEGKTLTAAVQSSIVDFYSDKFGMYAGWAQAVIFNAQLMNKEGSKTIKASRKRKS